VCENQERAVRHRDQTKLLWYLQWKMSGESVTTLQREDWDLAGMDHAAGWAWDNKQAGQSARQLGKLGESQRALRDVQCWVETRWVIAQS
jgi:hypothetical protein